MMKKGRMKLGEIVELPNIEEEISAESWNKFELVDSVDWWGNPSYTAAETDFFGGFSDQSTIPVIFDGGDWE